MKKMSVRSLHIDDQLTWRGGQVQVLHLLMGLERRGVQAELITQPGSILGNRARKDGIRVHDIRMRGEADIFAARRMARLIRRENYDIVHLHTAHAHTLGLLACAFNRHPGCVVHRRVNFPVNPGPLGLAKLKYFFRVDAYIAISNAVKKTLLAAGVDEKKIFVVHSGVEPSPAPLRPGTEVRHLLNIGRDTPLIGNVGALANGKGHQYLVEAVPLVLQRFPQARFIIVGEGEMRPHLQSLASRLGVQDAIMFPGFQTDVPGFMSAFDVYVAPSDMEGLNTSIIDAMMLARPVIATDVGGIPELIEHEATGLLVPPKNPAALGAAIVELLDRPQRAQQMGAAGKMRAMRGFTIDHMVEGVLEVYTQLLARKWKT